MAQNNQDNSGASRRNFIRNLAVLAPSVALTYRAFANPAATGTKTGTGTGTSTGAASAQSTGGGTAGFVSDSDPTAKALGYVADGSKADRPKKGDTEGKDQKCENCQFYVAGSPVNGKPAGKCIMIPAGPVPSEAWCKSWMKKA